MDARSTGRTGDGRGATRARVASHRGFDRSTSDGRGPRDEGLRAANERRRAVARPGRGATRGASSVGGSLGQAIRFDRSWQAGQSSRSRPRSGAGWPERCSRTSSHDATHAGSTWASWTCRCAPAPTSPRRRRPGSARLGRGDGPRPRAITRDPRAVIGRSDPQINLRRPGRPCQAGTSPTQDRSGVPAGGSDALSPDPGAEGKRRSDGRTDRPCSPATGRNAGPYPGGIRSPGNGEGRG